MKQLQWNRRIFVKSLRSEIVICGINLLNFMLYNTDTIKIDKPDFIVYQYCIIKQGLICL